MVLKQHILNIYHRTRINPCQQLPGAYTGDCVNVVSYLEDLEQSLLGVFVCIPTNICREGKKTNWSLWNLQMFQTYGTSWPNGHQKRSGCKNTNEMKLQLRQNKKNRTILPSL